MERTLQHESYVCPQCFEHINKCTCDGYLPNSLIVVDPGIREHIRILNTKGYSTRFCCESHDPFGNLYIMFQRVYGFGKELPLPEGFKGKHLGAVVEHTYGKDSRARKKMAMEEFELEKAECLAALLKWCEELPENEKELGRRRIRPRFGKGCPLDYQASIEELLDNYMCVRCGESVTNCTCELFPPSNIRLTDKGIRRYVDVLGERDYEVEFACAGHGPNSSIRIMFHVPPKAEALDALPLGFTYGKEHGWTFVEHHIGAELSPEEARADKNEALESLLKWCEELEAFSHN